MNGSIALFACFSSLMTPVWILIAVVVIRKFIIVSEISFVWIGVVVKMIKVVFFVVFGIHQVAAKCIDDKGQESYNDDTEHDVNQYFS
jgi:hypothetical protein